MTWNPTLRTLSACAAPFLALASCGTQNYTVDQPLDANNKTIIIPMGEGPNTRIIGRLTTGLNKQGWRTYVTTGTATEQVANNKQLTRDEHNAHYEVKYKWDRVDTAIFPEENVIDFFGSVFDTQTGREHVTVTATSTRESTCIDKMLKAIQENTK